MASVLPLQLTGLRVLLGVALVLPIALALTVGGATDLAEIALCGGWQDDARWRAGALGAWCDRLALRCWLAGLPAVLVVGIARWRAGRIRPRPVGRWHWLHAVSGVGFVVQVGLFSVFNGPAGLLVPVVVALAVCGVGFVTADTARLGRAWRHGRPTAAAAALGWSVVVLSSVAGLFAWRIGQLVRDNLGWHALSHGLLRWDLHAAALITVGSVLVAVPVVMVVQRLLARARVSPVVGLAIGVLLVLGFARATVMGPGTPNDALDHVARMTPR